MKKANNIYIGIVLFLICSSIIFLSENYILIKNLNGKNNALQWQKRQLDKEEKKKSKINYSDILQKLNDIEGIQIMDFTRDNGKKITAHVKISGDKARVVNALKKIREKKNFYSIDNIRMEQDKYKNIKASADVNFMSQ
ncbi:hypothetical protein ACYUJ6_06215 [Clostridium sp. JNZ X4-2]